MATLVNVYGTARSGSTILDLMLGNAPDAFSCGEVSAWFRPYRRHHSTLECSCRQDPCPVWKRIGYVKERDFYHTVIRELGLRFIIDSSKDLCWLIDGQKWTRAGQIGTVNLLVWKDPIHLAYSLWKRTPLRVDWRKQFMGAYARFLATRMPFVAVDHAALAANPQQALAAVCAAIGMEYREGRERFWEKDHHYLFGSLGVLKQVHLGNSSSQPTPAFPSEFQEERRRIEAQVANDHEVLQVLTALRRADVSAPAAERDGQGVMSHATVSPIWYSCKTLVRRFRRYFPEPYDTSVP